MTAPIGAFISGCAGTTLTPQERAIFARANPWGLILFRRNCETPDQLKALTASFRQAVGRKNAPVFIDQEGGRVQRLGPPSNSWRKFPPARIYGELYAKDAVVSLRSARNVARLMAEDLIARNSSPPWPGTTSAWPWAWCRGSSTTSSTIVASTPGAGP